MIRKLHLTKLLERNRETQLYYPEKYKRTGYWCAKCRRKVDKIHITDQGPDPKAPKWIEVVATCHGKEEFYKLELGYRAKDGDWSIGVFHEFFTPKGLETL